MAEHRIARGTIWVHGPLAARPNAVGLGDWFGYLSDEGPMYRVLNDAWVEVGGPEAAHVVGGANEPAFQNNWGSLAGFGPVGFYKDGVHVYLMGVTQNSGDPAANSVVFTLPVGYRPAATRLIQSLSNAAANTFIQINTNGEVLVVSNLGASGAVYFDGLFFRL